MNVKIKYRQGTPLYTLFNKEAIVFQGDSMGHLQYILPKMQWLLWEETDAKSHIKLVDLSNSGKILFKHKEAIAFQGVVKEYG